MDSIQAHPPKQAAYHDKRVVTNKSYLIEPIVRHRILDSLFYKQYLFLANESTILPVITQHVRYIGGTDSVGRPSPFLCCLLRLLELEPSSEIVEYCLNQTHFKYVSALYMMYVRLTATNEYAYIQLEPYRSDYRKLRIQLKYPESVDGLQVRYKLSYVDEWSYLLLTQPRALGLILPRIPPRDQLEDAGVLQARLANFSDDDNADGEGVPESSDYESDSD
ncbi:hypothetical protein CAAN1_15S00188 [[Candida] anglica]|uniref:Pre-mRNA-splicing factor 38 n=1 Tax=[Candida] anglica TaxID=148631 RepID=A0ABP0E7T4_9ASCO